MAPVAHSPGASEVTAGDSGAYMLATRVQARKL
jgi:hypothetical protein